MPTPPRPPSAPDRRRRRRGWLAATLAVVLAACAGDPTGDSGSLEADRPVTLDELRAEAREAPTPSAPADDPAAADGADGTGGDEGRVDVLVHAKSAFDPWTEPTDRRTWAAMRRAFDAMVVYSPYFDERLELFDDPDTYAYIDLYGLKVDSSRDTRAQDHPDWVLRTAEGDPVYIPWGCDVPEGCPQYAADVGDEGFRDDFVERVRGLVESGYPGVLIDDVNLAWRLSDVEGELVTPENPRTGRDLELAEWRLDVVTLLERLRDEFPDTSFMHNSIWYADTPDFDADLVDRQIATADVIMLERGATDEGLVAGDGPFGYATFVAFIDRVHDLGANVLLLDETATTERQQVFNLATALLVNDGDDLVSTEDYELMVPGRVWTGFSTDLGAALGGHEEADGLWAREFEDGVVLLNEPGRATRTVDLGGRFTTAEGEVVSRVRLEPREAVVLSRGS